MDHDTALSDLGVTDELLTDDQKQQLDDAGWLVVRDVLTRSETAAMRRAVDELLVDQEAAGLDGAMDPGSEMVFGVTEKRAAFAPLLTTAVAWAAAHHVFRGEPFIGGNSNFRSPLPGCGLQSIHSDLPPLEQGAIWRSLQIVYAAGDITADMGATRIIPGSHLWGKVAHETVDDIMGPQPGQVALELPEGAVAMFNANLWHGGTSNVSGKRRYAIFAGARRIDERSRIPRSVPEPIAHLPEAALYLLAGNHWIENETMSNPVPCWCCGMRRTCHRKGTPDPAALSHLPDGKPLLYAQEMATYGVTPSTIA